MTANTLLEFLGSSSFGFLLKLFSLIAGLAFGVLGLGAKTRDDEGNLTQRGRIALVGLICTALLGITAQIYEFYGAQRKAAVEQLRREQDLARAERILHSVERGLYPMRGIKVGVELELPDKNQPLAELKSGLLSKLQLKPTCRGSGCPLLSKVDQQKIDFSSPLFPERGSEAFRILQTLRLFVRLYRYNDQEFGGIKGYRSMGGFYIDWSDDAFSKASLRVTGDSEFSLKLDGLLLPDESVRRANVYSLSDISPGAVSAYVVFDDDNLCSGDGPACDRLYHGMGDVRLRELEFKFPFPKTIRLTRSDAHGCQTSPRNALSVSVPRNIELLDNLGNGEDSSLPPPPCGSRLPEPVGQSN